MRRNKPSLLFVVLISVSVAPSIIADAHAAVRTCAPLVISTPQSAPTELQARKQALEAWAKAAGTLPSAWRLAVEKQTVCAPVAGQTPPASTCIIRARPCLIEQAPGRNSTPDVSPKPTPAPQPRTGAKLLNI